MKKFLLIPVLFLSLIPSGCAKTSSTTSPAALAPGALNQFDQTTYQTLAAAHAFAVSASSNAATLTATEKSTLNTLISVLNAADLVYGAYHSGAATQAAMQTQLNAVATAQVSFSTAVTGAAQ